LSTKLKKYCRFFYTQAAAAKSFFAGKISKDFLEGVQIMENGETEIVILLA
jgi:hypothetical protein